MDRKSSWRSKAINLCLLPPAKGLGRPTHTLTGEKKGLDIYLYPLNGNPLKLSIPNHHANEEGKEASISVPKCLFYWQDKGKRGKSFE